MLHRLEGLGIRSAIVPPASVAAVIAQAVADAGSGATIELLDPATPPSLTPRRPNMPGSTISIDARAALASALSAPVTRESAAAAVAVTESADSATAAIVAALEKDPPDNVGARSLAEAAAAKYPRSAAVMMLLGRALWRLSKLDDADTALTRSLDLAAAAPAWYLRGIVRAERGNLEAAYDDLTEAIGSGPVEPHYFYNRGVVSARMGREQDAKLDFGRAVRMNPKFRRAVESFGWARTPDA
jgi:tetratricopeptide (TPR) repeat protein